MGLKVTHPPTRSLPWPCRRSGARAPGASSSLQSPAHAATDSKPDMIRAQTSHSRTPALWAEDFVFSRGDTGFDAFKNLTSACLRAVPGSSSPPSLPSPLSLWRPWSPLKACPRLGKLQRVVEGGFAARASEASSLHRTSSRSQQRIQDPLRRELSHGKLSGSE